MGGNTAARSCGGPTVSPHGAALPQPRGEQRDRDLVQGALPALPSQQSGEKY